MKIALIGYGKMGKEIEKIALNRNHEIILKIDIDNINELTPENIGKADVAIEFSSPDNAYDNVMACFKGNTPIVCGTTGWLDKYDEVSSYCKNNNQTLFYAANYSIGVNIFFRLNSFLAKIMNNYSDYNLELEEIHHTQKLDSPSGTAIKIANDIIEEIDRKDKWEENSTDKNNNLNIVAKRIEDVPGTHIVKYDSDIDIINIEHIAKNRKGFALGAVLAAEYIADKKGLYSMQDLMQF